MQIYREEMRPRRSQNLDMNKSDRRLNVRSRGNWKLTSEKNQILNTELLTKQRDLNIQEVEDQKIPK